MEGSLGHINPGLTMNHSGCTCKCFFQEGTCFPVLQERKSNQGVLTRQRHRGGEIHFSIDQKLIDLKTEKSRIQVVDSPDVGRIMLIDGQIKYLDRYSHQLSELMLRPFLRKKERGQKILIIGQGNLFLTDYLKRDLSLDISLLETDEVLACIARKVLNQQIGNAMLFHSNRRLTWLAEQSSASLDGIICDSDMTMNLTEKYKRRSYKFFLSQFLPEAYRLLKPGGLLSIFSGGLNVSKNRTKLPLYLKTEVKMHGFHSPGINHRFVAGFDEHLSTVTAKK